MSVTGEESAEPDEQAPQPVNATEALRPGRIVPPSTVEAVGTLAAARDFCLRFPSFDGSLVELDNATVWPQTRFYRPDKGSPRIYHDGGVFLPDGRPCLEAVNAFSGMIHFPEKPALGIEPTRLPGTWLFGGFMRTHFGVMLVYSLGRLWALDHVDRSRLAGMIFIYNDGNLAPEPEKLRAAATRVSELSYLRDTLKLIAGDLPVHIVSDPLEVEKLIVPTGITGSMVLQGHPTFREMCARLTGPVDAKPTPTPPTFFQRLGARLRGRHLTQERRLYVSRSRLPARQSQFLLEAVLERNLWRNGYDIIHPQEMPVAAQVEAYRKADRILIAEGSAAHLLAMAVRPDHRIGVIQRRAGSERFTVQMRAFGARDTHTLAVMAARIVPKDESVRDTPRVNVSAPAVLDFVLLRDKLAERGFISPRLWDVPSQEEIDRALAEYVADRRKAPGRRNANADQDEFTLQQIER